MYTKEIETQPRNTNSKYNSTCKKQFTILIISNEKCCHYLSVKKLLALLRGISSKTSASFIVWIAFALLEQKINLNGIKKYVHIKIFVELLKQLIDNINLILKDNILKFNQYKRSDKAPCIIYAYLEYLIKKIDNRKNNPKKSSLKYSINRWTYFLRILNVNYMVIW